MGMGRGAVPIRRHCLLLLYLRKANIYVTHYWGHTTTEQKQREREKKERKKVTASERRGGWRMETENHLANMAARHRRKSAVGSPKACTHIEQHATSIPRKGDWCSTGQEDRRGSTETGFLRTEVRSLTSRASRTYPHCSTVRNPKWRKSKKYFTKEKEFAKTRLKFLFSRALWLSQEP